MKKALCFALAALLLLMASAFALGEGETGMWTRRAVLDEFNMPTGDVYVTNTEPITGTFNDATRSDLPLSVQLIIGIGDGIVSIRLIESGTDIVKNTSPILPKLYSVTMLDSTNERHALAGRIPSGGDAVVFDEDDSASIVGALTAGGPVRFAITESFTPTNKYVFSIEETTDFVDYLPDYTDVGPFSEGLIPVQKGGKWGYVDATGTPITAFEWDYVHLFREGVALVFTGTLYDALGVPQSGTYGFVNADGEMVTPCKWTHASFFADGLAAVEMDGQWGFIDKTGKTALPFEWEWALGFDKGLAEVRQNGKWGVINTEGELVIPCEWDSIGTFDNGIARASVSAPSSSKAGNATFYGFIDTAGKTVVPCVYDDTAYYFYEDLVAVKKDGKWGFVDTAGNEVIPCTWDKVGNFYDGLAWVFVGTVHANGLTGDGKYGYIDSTGSLVIPCVWDDAINFSEGLARVKQGFRYGYIDKTGELVIPCEWLSANQFKDGLAPAVKRDLYGLIDAKGELVVPYKWKHIMHALTGDYWLTQNGNTLSDDVQYGLIDSSGNVILPCEYDRIQYGDGHYTMCRNGELIILDSEFNRIN